MRSGELLLLLLHILTWIYLNDMLVFSSIAQGWARSGWTSPVGAAVSANAEIDNESVGSWPANWRGGEVGRCTSTHSNLPSNKVDFSISSHYLWTELACISGDTGHLTIWSNLGSTKGEQQQKLTLRLEVEQSLSLSIILIEINHLSLNYWASARF